MPSRLVHPSFSAVTALSRVTAELAIEGISQAEVRRPRPSLAPGILGAMPSFEKSPPDLVRRFYEIAELLPEARRRQMFGYPTCVVNGNLFVGLHQDRFFLRLAETDRESFIRSFGSSAFEPMPGRPMREYVVVPPELMAGTEVEEWATRAFEFAYMLPPKVPGTTAKKGRRRATLT
ncbi:MAG: TfoX/Sxy family protein [Candidatus Dormiibacterota bacterium]